jgi:hypothetical protein
MHNQKNKNKGKRMPTLSLFFGILITMYFYDNDKHHKPHFHIKYQDFKAVIAIETGEILAGQFPPNKLKLVQAWCEIHRDDLFANWQLALNGEELFRIDPLK